MKKAVILLALAFILLLLPSAFAGNESEGGIVSPICKDAQAFDFEKQTECNIHSYVLNANYVLSEASRSLMKNIQDISSFNVDLTESRKAFNLSWAIAGAFLVLMATYTGYMFISSAGFPEKREQAQNQLKNVIFAAVFILALMPFIILTNDLANSTNNMFFSKYLNTPEFTEMTTLDTFADVEKEGGDAFSSSISRFSYLTSTNSYFVNAANLFLISLHGRKVALMFLVSIAPLALLMYYFEPTREFGKLLAYLYFIELFIPVALILTLWFGAMLAPGGLAAEEQLSKMAVITASLFFAVFLHAAVTLAAIGKAVFNIVIERRLMARKY